VCPTWFSISDLSVRSESNGSSNGQHRRYVTVELELRGRGSPAELATELTELEGVVDVRAGAPSSVSD
jgi:hypothetical protein